MCVPAPIIAQNEAFDQSFFLVGAEQTGAWSGKMAGLCALYFIIEEV